MKLQVSGLCPTAQGRGCRGSIVGCDRFNKSQMSMNSVHEFSLGKLIFSLEGGEALCGQGLHRSGSAVSKALPIPTLAIKQSTNTNREKRAFWSSVL